MSLSNLDFLQAALTAFLTVLLLLPIAAVQIILVLAVSRLILEELLRAQQGAQPALGRTSPEPSPAQTTEHAWTVLGSVWDLDEALLAALLRAGRCCNLRTAAGAEAVCERCGHLSLCPKGNAPCSGTLVEDTAGTAPGTAPAGTPAGTAEEAS